MKRSILTIMLAAFVLACGQAQEPQQKAMKKSTPETTAEAKNYIAEGMEALNNQDVVGAIKAFDSAIKADPQNPDNYMVLGQVYLRLRNYDKAVDTFNAGTRVAPNNGELFYFLGAANAVRHAMAESAEKKDFYRDEGIVAAKRSIEIFIEEKDEEKFKRAAALLKSLQEGGVIGTTPNQT